MAELCILISFSGWSMTQTISRLWLLEKNSSVWWRQTMRSVCTVHCSTFLKPMECGCCVLPSDPSFYLIPPLPVTPLVLFTHIVGIK